MTNQTVKKVDPAAAKREEEARKVWESNPKLKELYPYFWQYRLLGGM